MYTLIWVILVCLKFSHLELLIWRTLSNLTLRLKVRSSASLLVITAMPLASWRNYFAGCFIGESFCWFISACAIMDSRVHLRNTLGGRSRNCGLGLENQKRFPWGSLLCQNCPGQANHPHAFKDFLGRHGSSRHSFSLWLTLVTGRKFSFLI